MGTGWSPAGTSTTSSRSSGACSTRMEVRIDASEYKPEELKVSVQSGRLLVEGRHEEKKEDGSGYIQRSFSRSYTLPKEAEADKIVSNLSSEGILVITTPKSAP